MTSRKDKEKNYPQLRFPGFTDAWERHKLKELANIVRGASPRPIQDPKWFDDTSEVGWLRIADVTEQNGRIHHLEQRISALGQEKTRVLASPHLLLSIAATVGKPVVNYVKTGVHDGFLIFENPKFDREFMFQWLEMFRPMWQRYGQPGSQVNLNSNLVKNQGIILPSMEEQHKIGSFFKQLDHLITLHQRKLEHLKLQKKGLLQKMFPKKGEVVPEIRFPGFTDAWEQHKLGEVFKYKQGQQVPIESQFKTYAPNRHRFIRIVDITQTNEPIRYIYYTGENVIKKTDLFMIRYGQPGIVGYGYSGVIANNLFRLIPKINIENLFFYYIFESLYPKISSLSSSTTMPALSFKTLDVLSVKYPKIEEQQKIGTFFKQLDNTITLHQRKLEHLQLQKKSLLQKMFC